MRTISHFEETGAPLIAIDPGTARSAIVAAEPLPGGKLQIIGGALMRNPDLLRCLWDPNGEIETESGGVLLLEGMDSYGKAVGREVFTTLLWSGRFWQAYICGGVLGGREVMSYTRREVKLHLCGTARAKDSNILQAVVDRFGGSRAAAVGTKKSPGPCYGFAGDLWAALALAVAHIEKQEETRQWKQRETVKKMQK